jgi:hypothetical protein
LSRLETGDRGASQRDINDLCDLYEVDDQRRQRLLKFASKGKQRPWWPLDLPYSDYVGLEQGAVAIRDYGLGVLPGLLQTEDYARAVVQAAVPRWEQEVVEQRVQARMTRQQLLFSDNAPRFEAVVEEWVLHQVVGNPAVMQAQLERLLELSELPNVTLRVVPDGAGASPAPNSKFIIVKFELPDIADPGFDIVFDIVFIEGLIGDQYLKKPEETVIYNQVFDALVEQAAEPKETYRIISGIAEQHLTYHRVKCVTKLFLEDAIMLSLEDGMT